MNPIARLRTGVVAVVALGVVLSVAAPADAAPPKRTPAPVVNVSPASPTNLRTAVFTFSDSAPTAVFACSFDGAKYVACTSPVTKTGLTEGTHTMTVRATVPTWRSSSAFKQLVVDLTAPLAPVISAMPVGPTGGAIHPTFSDASTDVKGFLCSVDSAAAVACTSGAALDAAADGLRSLSVRAVDNAGNIGPAATATWIRDTAVAAPIVTSSPASPTVDTAATFTYASTDLDAVYQCSLDGGAYASCPSTGVHYTGLAVGGHTFAVKAADAVGNVSSPSTTFSWTVEAPAPNLVAASWTNVANLPAAISNSASGTFEFSTTNTTGVTCQIDGGLPAACTSPLAATSLTDGQHIVIITAAGVGGPVVLVYSWYVDTTAPAAPTVYGPAAFTNATSVSAWVVPSALDDTMVCTLDSVATPCTLSAPLTGAGLAEGAHSIVATETDKAGNSAQTTHAWTIDTVAPTYTVALMTTNAGAAIVTFNEDVTAAGVSPAITLATGAAVATVRSCLTALGAATPCTSSNVRSVAVRGARGLVPGQYYNLVVNGAGVAPVTDVAGNAAALGTTAFRAQVVAQENDPITTQNWRRVSSSLAKGGSYVMQTIAGSRAAWSFTGSAFVTYLATGPANGIAYVYVDGRYKGAWNTYAARAGFVGKTVLTGAGTHTVSILVTGKRGSRLGKGAAIGIDAFVVGRTLTKTPVLTTTWRRASLTGSSGGAQAFSALAGTSFSTPFRGTRITWSHATGPAYGLATVYVDGVKKATVDCYSASARAAVRWNLTGLTDAQHTILVVVNGTKRTASKGTLVSVDYFSTI